MTLIQDLIAQMTLEEKASLCSGQNFWFTKPIEHLGIPSIMLTDGPHGLRKQVDLLVITSGSMKASRPPAFPPPLP
jgi:hypothetical protein